MMLLFTTILNIKSTKKQKILYILILPSINVLVDLFLPDSYRIIVNFLIYPILVYVIFKTSILKAILSEIIPLMIGFLMETIVFKCFSIAFNITNDIAYSVPLYRFSLIIITYSCWFGLYKLCRKIHFNITILDNINHKNKLILLSNSIFMILSFTLQTFILFYYIDNLPFYITLIFIVILLAYYIVNFYSLTKTMQLQLTELDLEQSQQYNKTLVIMHDNIRCFRHDYANTVTAIGGFINSNDLEGLKTYYNQMLKDCERVKNLSALSPKVINNPAIYSLLTNKYHQATELGININVETFLDFNNLNMNTYEFTKILGILLDNAIESSKECEEKLINVEIRNDFNVKRQILIVKNTYKDKNLDTEKIYEKGFTSKPGNTGLGLWETRQILKRRNNLNLYTTKDEKYFIQQLEIYN